MKHFAGPDDSDRRGERLETRFMARTPEGWLYRTYRWDADGDDAVLVRAGDTIPLHTGEGPLDYVVPDEAKCGYCHAATAEEVLGPRAWQLDRLVRYADGVAPQLEVLTALRVLAERGERPPWPDPFDASLPVEPRARAWLAANCGHCHQPGGWRPPSSPSTCASRRRSPTRAPVAKRCSICPTCRATTGSCPSLRRSRSISATSPKGPTSRRAAGPTT